MESTVAPSVVAEYPLSKLDCRRGRRGGLQELGGDNEGVEMDGLMTDLGELSQRH